MTALWLGVLYPQQAIDGVHNLFIQYDQLVGSVTDTHLNQRLQDLVDYLKVIRADVAGVGL